MAYYSSEASALYLSLRINQPAGFFPSESSALYLVQRLSQPAGFFPSEAATLFRQVRIRTPAYFSLNEDAIPLIPQPLSVNFTGAGHSAASISGGTVVAPGLLELNPTSFTRSGGDTTINSTYGLTRTVPLADTARWMRARASSVGEVATTEGFRYRSSTGGGYVLVGTEYFEHFDARLPVSAPRYPSTLQFSAVSARGAIRLTLRLTPSAFTVEAQVVNGASVTTVSRAISALTSLRILRGAGQCLLMVNDSELLPSTASPPGDMRFDIVGSTQPFRVTPLDHTMGNLELGSLMLANGRIQPTRAQQPFSFHTTMPPAEEYSDIIICGPWGLANRTDLVYSQRLVPAPYVGTNVRGR